MLACLSGQEESERTSGSTSIPLDAAEGNILWDAVAFIDSNAKKAIKNAGGIRAIALSHPHFLGACVEIAEEFDVPIYMSAKDKEWISCPSDRYKLFTGEACHNVLAYSMRTSSTAS